MRQRARVKRIDAYAATLAAGPNKQLNLVRIMH